MTSNKEILPIGTVVLLNNGLKKLLISGYMPVMKKENKVFDYCGVLFPEGMIDDEVFFFNHSDIKEIIYTGFKDDDFNILKDKIENIYAKKASEKIIEEVDKN